MEAQPCAAAAGGRSGLMAKRARTDREDDWLRKLSALLLDEEAGVAAALRPLVEQTVDDLETLIAELPASSPSRDLAWTAAQPKLEVLLSRLNRRLEAELGRTLAGMQRTLRRHAVLLAPGKTDQPLRTAGQLLKLIRVDGTPLADLFRERSLSRWAQSIRDSIERQVRNGWARDQAARKLAIEVGTAALATINRAIEGVTATAIWSLSDVTQQEVWAGKWVWRTRRDEKVCSICQPLDGVVVDSREYLPDCPAHYACRCSCIVLTD
jgi:hypothetical protein